MSTRWKRLEVIQLHASVTWRQILEEKASETFSNITIFMPSQLLAKIDQRLLCPIFLQLRLSLLKGNFPLLSDHPFFYKSMIEIVCDNRHSNWADQNNKRAKNGLNTIYKSVKWQCLQESVKEWQTEGRRWDVFIFHPKASYDLSPV